MQTKHRGPVCLSTRHRTVSGKRSGGLPSAGGQGKGGEGELYGKSNMETYILMCKIDSQWEFAVWFRKLKQGLCINLEGWDGKGDGREFQKGGKYIYLWMIHVEV